MHWKIKGCVQKILSVIPGGEYANDKLQMIGGLRDFDENINSKIVDWKLTCQYLSEVGFPIPGAIIMEVGTGWYPVLPVCFSLAGVASIETYDIHRHINFELTGRALASMERHLDEIAGYCAASPAEVKAKFEKFRQAASIEELLRLANIHYHAPGDARNTGLPENSVDLAYSNSVFEHVPREAILDILKESRRFLKPGGLALHNVGCNDHYAFFDRSISFVNFLRFTESEWRLWNNSLLYQNRLRAPHFLEMAESAGLKVVYKRTSVRPGSREALEHLTVAPEFRDLSRDDLAITSLDFISQKVA